MKVLFDVNYFTFKFKEPHVAHGYHVSVVSLPQETAGPTHELVKDILSTALAELPPTQLFEFGTVAVFGN